MLIKPLSTTLRIGALATLLGGAMASAHAGGVSVGLDLGLPLPAVYSSEGAYGPIAAVNVGYRGGGHRGGYYRGGGWGWGWGGLVLATPWIYGPVVVAQPSTVIIENQPQPAASLPAPPARPEPVIYPRNGQTAEQTEADRQACNRWATTQPAALSDSTVFMRAVDACLDGRGYTTK
jgi:hypothetical protein